MGKVRAIRAKKNRARLLGDEPNRLFNEPLNVRMATAPSKERLRWAMILSYQGFKRRRGNALVRYLEI
jgi:hypothetical protein